MPQAVKGETAPDDPSAGEKSGSTCVLESASRLKFNASLDKSNQTTTDSSRKISANGPAPSNAAITSRFSAYRKIMDDTSFFSS
jgi:hypothetical protein